MAISMNAVIRFANANGGNFADAAFGVKRSKRDTADGSTVDGRLVKRPASLDAADMAAAASVPGGGIIIGGTSGAAYAKSIALYGAAADSFVRAAMANDESVIAVTAPAVEPEPSESVPETANRTNGRARARA